MDVVKAFTNGQSDFRRRLIDRLESRGGRVYASSIVAGERGVFFLLRSGRERRVGVLSADDEPRIEGESETLARDGGDVRLVIGSTSAANADAVRKALPSLAPRVLGLRRSVGCGDRLGKATPGHVRSMRKNPGLVPIFAQQSIREMERTGRSPRRVMDDALWGALQEGWLDGFGADADHLKTPDDVDRCIEAGFTFFTIDPSEHVNDTADAADSAQLAGGLEALPWDGLEITFDDLRRRYVGKHAAGVNLDDEALGRAAVKYGAAVEHTVRLYRHLRRRKGEAPFELEMSVDETEHPTSPEEHFFVAAELARLGVEWVSLAPRFVGRLEKGVDYVGDPNTFEQSLNRHLAVAREVGPYKLSLHSGSDKFSIYPIFAKYAGELFHLKTAGTSYLEALRATAISAPELFRMILDFARDRFEEDRATYHVSADLSKVPPSDDLHSERSLEALLDDPHVRQVLHVTYGSVLMNETLATQLNDSLLENEASHYAALEAHFDRHLEPFR